MFRQLSARVLHSMRAGASVADAARHVECSPRTVERWIARGRENPSSGYGDFAAAVDALRDARAVEPSDAPLSDYELRAIVSEGVRAGSVPAMRLYWEILLADPEPDGEASDNPLAEVDELAERRRQAAMGGTR